MTGYSKIHFRIEQDQDEYPPVSVETLWARHVADGFVLDSIPFFSRDATVDDVVQAVHDSSGNLWFSHVVSTAGHSLIRVLLYDDSRAAEVTEQLQSLGCGTEGMKTYKLIAVDIPPTVSLSRIQDFLRSESSLGHIDYEEAILRHEAYLS